MKPLNIKIRIVIYILAFVITAAVTYMVEIGGVSEKSENSDSIGGAGLPVLYMTTESGIKYNFLHGYTGVIDETLIRDAITPITSERQLKVSIQQYGSIISDVTYEIQSLDKEELIERTTVEDVSGSDGVSYVNLKFKNLLDVGKEYMLKITVSTEQNKPASYYTRIVIMDDALTDNKLKYINNFSSCTLDEEKLDAITAKLETNSSGDNTNLGRVNIHSKLSQVGYGELDPEIVSDRYITLNEIDGTVASVTVRYVLETEDETGNFKYNVKEFYRINQPDDTVTYVYSYDRWMEQIFNPEYAATSSGDMYLGIMSDDNIVMEKSENGNITVFEREKQLWEYNASKKKYTKIFSFSESEGDNLRESYPEHGIKILDVDKSGNVDFLVYGYMNRGSHEGMTGISVFSYDAVENVTKEVIFIARRDLYKNIEKDIEKLAYLNESNILYMYQDGTVYYIDCTTRECMLMASDVKEADCMASDESGLFMYRSDSADTICVINLENGETGHINAADDTDVKPLGFIDGNIVYGEAYSKMISTGDDGKTFFPMYRVMVANEALETIKCYQSDNIYVTGAEFEGTKITFSRVEIVQNTIRSIDDDYILSNLKEKSSLKLSIRSTEKRQKERYITLIGSAAVSDSSIKYAHYEFLTDSPVEITDNQVNTDNRYYVYSYGENILITSSLSDAIITASDAGGVVTDDRTVVVWTRYKSSDAAIDIGDINASSDTRLAATLSLIKHFGVAAEPGNNYEKGYTLYECINEIFGNVCNLTGCSVEQLEYFIDNGSPVIIKTDEGRYELMYAYTKSTVSVADYETGQKISYNIKEYQERISHGNNVIISTIYQR